MNNASKKNETKQTLQNSDPSKRPYGNRQDSKGKLRIDAFSQLDYYKEIENM